MAVNDAEINIGVNLDADQFSSAFENLLSKTSQTTQNYITNALDPDNMKGAATKSWEHLPFTAMHDPIGGNITASKAFMASLAEDLKGQGMKQRSLGFQSAMLSAAYKSSIPDPMERYHRLLADGVTYYQADEVYPTTRLSKMIESDYALMEQDWARDFIKTRRRKGKVNQFIDFEGMREFAVGHGLGRWIDPEKEHTADNFELINDELEKIEENSDKSDKTFRGWNDTLKGVLGTLTAIGGITGLAKTFEIAYNAAEKGTTQAATSLPRTRAFVGMNALDVLAAQNAGRGVGLGKDDIYNEIVNLSNRREEYKLLGQGLDALFPSLSGIFDNIMSGDNPYETYKSILTELYGALQGADDDIRAQALMLLDKQGLGSASYIIGSFLSNPKLAAEMDNDPTKLFSLKSNPYRNSYLQAEAMLPDLAQLNESIASSYNQMYLDWEIAFGKPFKTWWDDTLKDKVVPWFEKIVGFVTKDANGRLADDAAAQIAFDTMGAVAERNKAISKNSGRVKYEGYKLPEHKIANSRWEAILGGDMRYEGKAARAQWDIYNEIADYSDNDIANVLGGTPAQQAQYRQIRNRIKKMRDKLVDTQLSAFLDDTKKDDVDAYLLQAFQSGIYGSTQDWEANFNAYIEKLLSTGAANSKSDDAILEILRTIASNTEASKALLNNKSVWSMFELTWGKSFAEQGQRILNR